MGFSELGLLEGRFPGLYPLRGMQPAPVRGGLVPDGERRSMASAARSGMCLRKDRKGFSMGFRRRTRRRALIAGAVAGGAIAHHEAKQAGQQQAAYDDQAAADGYQDQAAAGGYQDQAAAGGQQDQAQYAPPPADPADQIEHLAQLHTSGALTDEEFSAAKAQILGS